LLAEHEQKLFAGLPVFSGSFDLEGAAAVCDAELDTLASLLDKSLVRQTGEGRFFMLETIREYALERLDASAEAETLRRRHAEYFAQVLEAAYEHFRRPGQEAWLAAIAAEHENVRAALEWAERVRDKSLTLAIAAHASYFWYVRGHVAEGVRLLERALAGAEGERSRIMGLALNGAAALACSRGDYERGVRWAEQSVSMLGELGRPRDILHALTTLASIVIDTDERARADGLLDRALVMAHAEEDEFLVAGVLVNMCNLALTQHDYGRAVELGRQCSELLEQLGAWHPLAIAWSNTGVAELALGDVSKAESLFAGALQIAHENGISEVTAWCLTGLAAVAAHNGDVERAAGLLGLTEVAMVDSGVVLEPAELELFSASREAVETDLGPDRLASAMEAGRSLDIEDLLTTLRAGTS
jgi:tetratricopeptide (TPR) repeat protein